MLVGFYEQIKKKMDKKKREVTGFPAGEAGGGGSGSARERPPPNPPMAIQGRPSPELANL